MIDIKVTDQMMQYIKDNVFILVNESANRASISIGGDWEGICRRVIELHENVLKQRMDRILMDINLHHKKGR